jgi:sulfite exporter TauE/SafE
MISVLLLGFLMGIRHALEADHILAVATLVESKNSGEAMKQGLVWGIGHTLTLLVLGAVFISFDFLITESASHILELIVGIMLVILGIDLLRKIYNDRIHLHPHKHANGINHLHFHVHPTSGNSTNNRSHQSHSHSHIGSFPIRALLIGFMHGLAGSSVLIILTLKTIHSPLTGLIYILLFGLGSIVSMALTSVVIAIPVRQTMKKSQWLYGGFRSAIATFTLIFGMYIVYDSGVASGLLIL